MCKVIAIANQKGGVGKTTTDGIIHGDNQVEGLQERQSDGMQMI